jgi:hypothetical protein
MANAASERSRSGFRPAVDQHLPGHIGADAQQCAQGRVDRAEFLRRLPAEAAPNPLRTRAGRQESAGQPVPGRDLTEAD